LDYNAAMSFNGTALRLGVIGLGEIARSRHLPALAQLPQWQITIAADLDQERGERTAAQFAISQFTNDPCDVIASKLLDALAILTPPASHADLIHAALGTGKPIFVEKPLTLDVAQAETLEAETHRTGCKLLVGFNLRHHIQVQQAREWIRSGKLGRVRAVHTLISNVRTRAALPEWRRDPKRGGELLFDLGVHHFDLCRFLFDAEIATVQAYETCSPQGNLTVATLAQLTNDILVTCTFVEDAFEHDALEIFGENGRLVISLYRFDGLQWYPRGKYDGSIDLRFALARSALQEFPRALPRMQRGGEYVLTYRSEWEHFYTVIQNNVLPLANVHDGVAATRAAFQARQSITGKALTPIPPPGERGEGR
jgi:predicted dehydrogenase